MGGHLGLHPEVALGCHRSMSAGIMHRLQRALTVLAGCLLLGLALLWPTFWPAPLPAPEPFSGELPRTQPPPSLVAYRISTGVTHRSAGSAYRGGGIFDRRDFAMTSVLVRQPAGDVLIDTGLGRDVAQQLELMPWWFRETTAFTRTRSTGEQLRQAGYDPDRLLGVLLSPAHWDHGSGLAELGRAPVLVSRDEADFVATGGWLTAVTRSAGGDRVRGL